MTVETVSSRPPATRGCRCGGCAGGGACGGACGCGSGEARAPAGGFARPRFFAGQLLNDEDLEAIETYVVGKNRLHNRFLHGDGVVCGLEVACHPCGGGKVLVASGYAIDCCGNDIVVPCREELDILEMLRELRTATAGGYDCGDPCGHHDQPGGQDQGGTQGDAQAGSGGEGGKPTGEPPRQSRRYWLYVRYAERLSDPVAPYATGEPCDPTGCEATRVREGYQFVLRCHRSGYEDEDVLGRVLDCVGRPEELLKTVGAARWAREFGERLRAGLDLLQQATSPPSRSDFEQPGTARLRAFVDGGQRPADEAAAGQLLDDLTATAATLLRAKLLGDADRQAAGLDDELLVGTSNLLRTAVQRLGEQAAADLLDAAARPFAEAGMRTAARAADQPAGQPLPGDLALLARGVAADNRLLTTTAGDLREQRSWLLDKVEHTPYQTDCGLATEVAAVRIPVIQRKDDDSGEGATDDPEGDRELAAAADQLSLLTRRYLIGCVCAAVNPPCRPCPDDAVLLAGIDVLDCEVEDICQVVRGYVPTGPTLRYWVPQLNRLPKLLELACCTDELLKPAKPGDEGGQTQQPPPTFLAAGPRPVPAAATVRDRALLAVGDQFASLAGTGRDTAALLSLSAMSPRLVTAELARAAAASPEVRAVVGGIAVDALGGELGAVRANARRQLEEVVAGLTGAAAVEQEVDTAVHSRMGAMRRDLGEYKRQASRQLGRLETTVQQRLGELERELAEVRRLRDELARAQPATGAGTPDATPTGPPAEAPEAATEPEAQPRANDQPQGGDQGGARRRGRRQGGSRKGGRS
jgi:hypothetical protein